MSEPFRECACGCGQRVKSKKCRWFSPQCVPLTVRQENGAKSRRAFAYRKRAATFRKDLERLPQRLTHGDLLELLQRVYMRSYNSGYQQGLLRSGLERAVARGAA
jgi:hypothetical protein